MNRYLTYIIGPETILAALTAVIFWVCARYNSGEGRDIQILEQLVVFLPFIVVPLVFATIFVPGAKSWSWLGRAVILTYAMLGVCAYRIIAGFGTGAKGQDAAFILVIAFGSMFIGLGSTVASAMIMADLKPAFADWFRSRKVIGSILTLLASIPIGLGLGIVVMSGLGIAVTAFSAFKR